MMNLYARLGVRRSILAPLMIALAIGCATSSPAAAQDDGSVLEWEGPAHALSKLSLRAGNGSLTIKAVAGDRVRVRVEITPKRWTDDEPERKLMAWFLTSGEKSAKELVDSVRLHPSDKGDRLELSLRPNGRTRKAKINENWTVEVPARLNLDAKFDAAEVDIVGIKGGVTLRLGYGTARLDLGGGNLDLKVTKGDLKVRTQGDYGDIKVRSTVGNTELWLHGLRIQYVDPPGPGSRVSVDGEGVFKARVEAEVGDAELRVNQ